MNTNLMPFYEDKVCCHSCSQAAAHSTPPAAGLVVPKGLAEYKMAWRPAPTPSLVSACNNSPPRTQNLMYRAGQRECAASKRQRSDAPPTLLAHRCHKASAKLRPCVEGPGRPSHRHALCLLPKCR